MAHYRTTGTNPLPRFRNDFVLRLERGNNLYIKPAAPKPDELDAFTSEARRAGFQAGPLAQWGNRRAPAYWRKSLAELPHGPQ